VKTQTDQKTGIISKWPYIAVVLLLLFGVARCYGGRYRVLRAAELLPETVEEAERCQVSVLGPNRWKVGPVTLYPAEREVLMSLLEGAECRQRKRSDDIIDVEYRFFTEWPNGERRVVVSFTADLIGTNSGIDAPSYLILSGGEELEAFAEQVLSRAGDPGMLARILNGTPPRTTLDR